MKKVISVALLSIALAFSLVLSAYAEEVSDSGNGMTKVQFSNGYIGFCIDSEKHGAGNGDSFTAADSTDVAVSNKDNSDISQKLKIMFTQCFDEIFTQDENGGYYVDQDTADKSLQTAIYHFSDNYWVSGTAKNLVNEVNAYTGPEIPDEGYQLELENGDVVTFYFKIMEPQNEDQQSFFAYKLTVSQKAPHEHEYGDKWENDGDNHWHECECGDKTDVAPHNGTTADCKNPSECEDCGEELLPVNPDNHTGNTEVKNDKPATEYEDGYTGDIHCADCGELITSGEKIPATHEHEYGDKWENDGDNHWHECECGDKTDEETHTITDGTCTVCGYKPPVTEDNNTSSENGSEDTDADEDDGADTEISVDLDAISGVVSELGSIIDIDSLVDLIPEFSAASDNGSEDASGEETDTEIPDTGSDSDIVIVFVLLSISLAAFAVTALGKKKNTAK